MKDFAQGGSLWSLGDEEVSSEELAWDHAMDISGSVYARLEEIAMSNKELAEKLGVTPGRVSQILKGYPGMSLKMLAKLEVALDFRLDGGFFYGAADAGVTASTKLSLSDRKNSAWGSVFSGGGFVSGKPSISVIKGGLFAA